MTNYHAYTNTPIPKVDFNKLLEDFKDWKKTEIFRLRGLIIEYPHDWNLWHAYQELCKENMADVFMQIFWAGGPDAVSRVEARGYSFKQLLVSVWTHGLLIPGSPKGYMTVSYDGSHSEFQEWTNEDIRDALGFEEVT